jgi:hypothetical protein
MQSALNFGGSGIAPNPIPKMSQFAGHNFMPAWLYTPNYKIIAGSK